MNKIVLVVVAHSDDEALGCAGTLAKHTDEGDEVHVLFMTDGVSSRGSSGIEVAKRRKMAEKSADLLKLRSVKHLSFPDNKMDSIPLLEVSQAIEKVVLELKPEIIYTHYIDDLNVDHQITHKAVLTACRPQPGHCVKDIYAFEVLSSTDWQYLNARPFVPNFFVDISSYINIKLSILEVYEEEMRAPPHTRSIQNVTRMLKVRGANVGLEYAEAFILIRSIDTSRSCA